jgi:tetratricopeptide (TPR) repeat protein
MKAPEGRSWFRLGFLLLMLLISAGILGRKFLPDIFGPRGEAASADSVPSEDPRRAGQGSFQNIHPDVKYVGTAACATANCHAGIAETYYQTPMARSLTRISHSTRDEGYAPSHHNPFQAFDSLFFVQRRRAPRGDHVWHRQSRSDEKGQLIYQDEMEVHYAIGSGNHGHSYLAVHGDGYLFQTPISWFSQKQIWDLSPGMDPALRRVITPECLFCHSNQARAREGYLNRYQTPIFSGHAIGCERCHGPGEEHARNPGLKRVEPGTVADLRTTVRRVDFTIVNPGKLKPALREAVCQQCHLEGESRVLRRGRGLYDFRPGLPLEEFLSIFVHARESGEEKKAVNHVEQMYLSRCFQRSEADGKLGCISCHDPHQHVGPERRLAHYRERCLQCHADGERTGTTNESGARSAAAHKLPAQKLPAQKLPCALPLKQRLQNQDDCMACHMPRYGTTDIAHAASTDHRIIRGGETKVPTQPKNKAGWNLPLVSFHRQSGPEDKELVRDLGIALNRLAISHKDLSLLAPSATFLDTALMDFLDDWEIWQERGLNFLAQQRYASALVAFNTILAKSPDKEATLEAAAAAAQAQGDLDSALDFWRRAAAMSPWRAEYQGSLAKVLARKQAWEELGGPCRQWLRLSPANLEARMLLIEHYIRTGKRAEANAELSRVEALRPPRLAQIKAWFQAQTEKK